MTTHILKIWPLYYEAIIDGRKTFEVRRDDRHFMEDDILELREFEEYDGGYTGRICHAKVTYVARLPGLTAYVGMSVELME